MKLATFSKYRNSRGRSLPFRKKGIACSLPWAKFIRRRAHFWRIRTQQANRSAISHISFQTRSITNSPHDRRNWLEFNHRKSSKTDIDEISASLYEHFIKLLINTHQLKLSQPGGGGGNTAKHGLYGYVPPWRVWFSSSLLRDRVYKSESLGLG